MKNELRFTTTELISLSDYLSQARKGGISIGYNRKYLDRAVNRIIKKTDAICREKVRS